MVEDSDAHQHGRSEEFGLKERKQLRALSNVKVLPLKTGQIRHSDLIT